MNKWFAEFLGTLILVFCGTGAIISQNVSGEVTHVGISLTFGLVVMAMVYSFGDISGAHINPAVTIGFWVAGRFPFSQVIPYIFMQCLGAIAASGVWLWLYPDQSSYGSTQPRDAWWQAFGLELLLTWILMLVILRVSSGSKEKGIMAGAAIGAVVALEALFAGPLCGASMNPARSLGPAVAEGDFQHLWIYCVATTLGAILAVITDLPQKEGASEKRRKK
ncbi:Aquaporin Z [Planctomycetales bacterium 10988]|nr:Aquaporin Z [Planctomycetales bacterium 10988]